MCSAQWQVGGISCVEKTISGEDQDRTSGQAMGKAESDRQHLGSFPDLGRSHQWA